MIDASYLIDETLDAVNLIAEGSQQQHMEMIRHCRQLTTHIVKRPLFVGIIAEDGRE